MRKDNLHFRNQLGEAKHYMRSIEKLVEGIVALDSMIFTIRSSVGDDATLAGPYKAIREEAKHLAIKQAQELTSAIQHTI